MPATIDMTQALAVLSRLATLSMVPWLAEVGRREVHNIRHRIEETKGSPDHQQWAPWRERTLRYRESRGNVDQGLLWDTGHLLNSVHYEVTPGKVEIGTEVPYAKELQEGRENMAARPFIGWGEPDLLGSDESNLEASAVAFIEAFMK